jgi:hypothetical protein
MYNFIRKIYHKPWFPRIFYKKYDGGRESGVTGYMLIEWKKVFSIGLLHFKKGSRENYHSHAFNAISWWLKGCVEEDSLKYKVSNGEKVNTYKVFAPSIKPKITMRNKLHRVVALEDTYAITFRGPWEDTWYEETTDGDIIRYTHGRKIIT